MLSIFQGYIVCEVTHSMNALSNFPSDAFETFCEYYKCKWNLTIENPTQPLLLVKAMSNRLNCLKPRYVNMNQFFENFITIKTDLK